MNDRGDSMEHDAKAPFNRAMGPLRKTLTVGGAAAALAAAGWLAYAMLGRNAFGRTRSDDSPSVLDAFVPRYDVSSNQETIVDAAPSAVFAAMRRFSFFQSPLISGLMHARAAILGAKNGQELALEGFVNEMKAFGWAVLDEVPGRRIVLGCATRPWEADVTFRPLDAASWQSFDEPNYVKIAVSIEALPHGTGTLLRTLTRAAATDEAARRRFRRYWAVFSPGIWLVRWEGLRLVRKHAEERP